METTGQATTKKKNGAKAAPKKPTAPQGQETRQPLQDRGPGVPARRGAESCFELAYLRAAITGRGSGRAPRRFGASAALSS
jgi:hypothetical protein